MVRQPMIRYFAIALLAVTSLLAALPTRSSAGSLSTAVIGMFPKEQRRAHMYNVS